MMLALGWALEHRMVWPSWAFRIREEPPSHLFVFTQCILSSEHVAYGDRSWSLLGIRGRVLAPRAIRTGVLVVILESN